MKGMRVLRSIRTAADELQPGRLPVLIALILLGGAALVATLAGTGAWRAVGVAGLAAVFVVGGLLAPWLFAPRYPRHPADYGGYYPPFPDVARVLVAAETDGLAVYLGRPRERRVLAYGRILRTDVAALPDGRRALELQYADRITQRSYAMRFVFRDTAADRILRTILRRQYQEADTPWAMWRALEIDVAFEPEDLERGATRLVPFTRQVACGRCAGVARINQSCPTCAGAAIVQERDVVELRLRRGAEPGSTFQYPDLGNEDINGVRGPLIVRVVVRRPETGSAGQ